MESFKESWRILKPFLLELLTKLGAQTGLYSHRIWLKALKFRKKRDCKNVKIAKAFSAAEVTLSLICPFVFAYA